VSEESAGADRMSDEMAQQLSQGPGRGALMRIAREKAGLSVQQLASGMNLSQKQILALESDDLSALPSAAFVRGFVRNYARIVGCDPAEFEVTEIQTAHRSDATPITLSPPAENMPIQSNRAHANRRWIIAAGLVVFIGLIGGYVKWEHVEQARNLIIQRTDSITPATPKLSAEDQPGGNVAPPISTESTSTTLGSSTSSSQPQGSSTPPVNSAPVPAPQVAGSSAASAAPAAPVIAPPASASLSVKPVLNAGGASPSSSSSLAGAPTPLKLPASDADSASPPRLDPSLPAYPVVLDFSQESWVDVREMGGKVFVHGIVKSGERREYQARGQVKVVIGNAPGVSLSWKGKTIDLTDSTKDSVAKLTLEPVAE